jgi:hypothetical protein
VTPAAIEVLATLDDATSSVLLDWIGRAAR